VTATVPAAVTALGVSQVANLLGFLLERYLPQSGFENVRPEPAHLGDG
jgi:hypothetical protein